ncbi:MULTISPECIES: hypothetical protein [unclassified Methylobacterium]|uniref:hypothetical protein n=1 Tax=unclassified Methylobacterium TaxID=2615210 RepID=UPI0036F92574
MQVAHYRRPTSATASITRANRSAPAGVSSQARRTEASSLAQATSVDVDLDEASDLIPSTCASKPSTLHICNTLPLIVLNLPASIREV